jgi:hypothetical protein
MHHTAGARGGAVGRGTALQAGRSRFRFRMVSLEFSIVIILPAANDPEVDSVSNRWVPWIFPEDQRRPVRRAKNLTTFMCRVSWNLGASNSWNPQGLWRPVMGLLYLYLYLTCAILQNHRREIQVMSQPKQILCHHKSCNSFSRTSCCVLTHRVLLIGRELRCYTGQNVSTLSR